MEEAPVELTCWIGGRLFAFEHTGIEPFEGQIKLESEARFKPLRDMFSGLIPKGEQYELYVPVRATLDLKKAQARSIILALSDWIRAEAPGLQLSPVGRFGTPATRQPIRLSRSRLPYIEIACLVWGTFQSLTSWINLTIRGKLGSNERVKKSFLNSPSGKPRVPELF
jgi:hypothetical protein